MQTQVNRYFNDSSKFGYIIESRPYLSMLSKISEKNNYIYEIKTEELGNFGYRYTLSVDAQTYIADRLIYNAILPIRLQDKITKPYPYE